MRFVEAGYFCNAPPARVGRLVNSPLQFGQVSFKSVSAQVLQNVHSNEQIIASWLSAFKSLSQHSQLGLSSNI